MLFKTILLAAAAVSSAFAQNCGAKYGNKVCAAGQCCSQYNWCGTTDDYCSASKNCQSQFSGSGSSCAKRVSTSMKVATSTFKGPYASKVPEIDVCGTGSGSGKVSCPGAGINGYFYRCCSSAGHCGPKNNIQDQGIYCGSGCQAGFGNCKTGVAKPPNPSKAPATGAKAGETCGPIVNKKCASGLCCSGSNFCGTGKDFCGSANWCQKSWGRCD